MKRKIVNPKLGRRNRRVLSIRKKIQGSAARPRLAVFRSARHIYAQLIDDDAGRTLAASSSRDKSVATKLNELNKSQVAELVGTALAESAKAKGIESAVFDRRGWAFHGRVAALAKGARDGGLRF